MTAERQSLGLPTGLPLTKFRVPRQRQDFVRRDALRSRLRRLTQEHPVTLITAPAGSGKTTLMVQLVDPGEAGETALWVALDHSDDDPPRLLATLVQSLLPLNLAWEMDPRALVANVTGSGSEARAVVAGIVNALCTVPQRVLWLLDDLQHLQDPGTAGLLEALIERLPAHVALVLGSRTEPALPLARLRVLGELGELDAEHLRFDEATVLALASERWGVAPPAEAVRDTLQRTRGWAVGVNLLLAAGAGAGAHRPAPRQNAPQRALFDFLAQEVLDELPPELRRFAVDCAVLADLSPSRCQALTGRSDSHRLLDALLRRHLFLSVVEDQEPVLRFHDLFRDFLLSQLAREPEAAQRALQERAAVAESASPERAIGHWLAAQRWAEAVELIARHGLRLASEGAYATLERWIEGLPPAVVANAPRLALLRAECAWSRWDWERVLRHAAPAAEGLASPDDLAGRLRARLLLCASLGALGRLEERAVLTESSLERDLPPSDAAQFHLQRAWSDFSLGRVDRIGTHLATMNSLVALDPARHAAELAPTFNCHFSGLPGVTEACLRFVALCDSVPKPAAMPWHSTPVVLGAWAALWQARRDGAVQALERSEQIQRSFGKVRYVLLDATHLQALLLATAGDVAGARRVLDGLLADLASGDAEGLNRVWQRPYRSLLARVLWMAQDGAALAVQAGLLAGPLREHEWPLVAGAVDTVTGQAALLDGALDAAEAALNRAVAHHASHPAPAFYADPRVALAAVHLRRHDRGVAWATLRPMLQEIERDGTPGRLLLEPTPLVAELLATCPVDAPERGSVQNLRTTLARWQPAAGETAAAGAAAVAGGANPLGHRLTERECEVLELVAQGLPNKLLARRLSLSAHTVKRHLANILDKLDCDNRGQAAALWRRGGG